MAENFSIGESYYQNLITEYNLPEKFTSNNMFYQAFDAAVNKLSGDPNILKVEYDSQTQTVSIVEDKYLEHTNAGMYDTFGSYAKITIGFEDSYLVKREAIGVLYSNSKGKQNSSLSLGKTVDVYDDTMQLGHQEVALSNEYRASDTLPRYRYLATTEIPNMSVKSTINGFKEANFKPDQKWKWTGEHRISWAPGVVERASITNLDRFNSDELREYVALSPENIETFANMPPAFASARNTDNGFTFSNTDLKFSSIQEAIQYYSDLALQNQNVSR